MRARDAAGDGCAAKAASSTNSRLVIEYLLWEEQPHLLLLHLFGEERRNASGIEMERLMGNQLTEEIIRARAGSIREAKRQGVLLSAN